MVVTEGGTVGNDMVVVEPGLKFSDDDRGIIFLQSSAISNANINLPAGNTFELYASRQGFIQYDLTDRTAHDEYNSYTNVPVQFKITDVNFNIFFQIFRKSFHFE